MRKPTYFILAALLEGPLHGYAIMKRAGELSSGDVRLSTGTLFGALDRLVGDGLVQGGREERVNGRVRREYSLTDAGRSALAHEAARLRAAARVVESRLATVATGEA